MKPDKKMIVLLVVAFTVLAAIVAVPAMFGNNGEYEETLQQARELYERDLCERAMNAYDAALGMEDSLALRIEMAEVYHRGFKNGEFDSFYKMSDFLYQIMNDYREDAVSYETALRIFDDLGETDECVSVLYTAEDLGVDSEKISAFREKIRYDCDLELSFYNEVSFVPNSTYLLRSDNYTIRDGNLKSVTGASAYYYATPMVDGYAVVKSDEQKAYIVNQNNVRYAYLPDGLTCSTGYGQGLIGCQIGETFAYYDANGQKMFGKYLFAGRFANGIAAVQTEKGWQIIDNQGHPVVKTVFADVKLSQSYSCAQFGFVIAKEKDVYHLYDAAMQKVSEIGFEDADLFYSADGLAACKMDGKWGFMNMAGEMVIKAQYEDARSFSYGLAGVKNGEYWSFIDPTGQVVITGEYYDANYFNINGGCFVKTDEFYWQYLVRHYNR